MTQATPSRDARSAVPDEAWDAVVEACPLKDVIAAKSAWDIDDLQQKAVEAAAPFIIAAKLDQFAELWADETGAIPDITHDYLCEWLRAEAAKLRGES